MDVAEQTSEMPQPTSVASSPHPPSAEEPRYPRRETPAQLYICKKKREICIYVKKKKKRKEIYTLFQNGGQ